MILEILIFWHNPEADAKKLIFHVLIPGDGSLTLRAQVPNSHIIVQNLYYNYYYPKSKYLIIGYMDPLGKLFKNFVCSTLVGVATVLGAQRLGQGSGVEWEFQRWEGAERERERERD